MPQGASKAGQRIIKMLADKVFDRSPKLQKNAQYKPHPVTTYRPALDSSSKHKSSTEVKDGHKPY